MVSIKALCSVLALQILAVSAAPAEDFTPPNKLEAKGSVYYCTNTRWNGACRTDEVTLDSCQNIPPEYNDQISSIRNNVKGSYKCTWYLDGNCNGDSYDNQEDANLADGNGKFNDSISSYSCRRK